MTDEEQIEDYAAAMFAAYIIARLPELSLPPVTVAMELAAQCFMFSLGVDRLHAAALINAALEEQRRLLMMQATLEAAPIEGPAN